MLSNNIKIKICQKLLARKFTLFEQNALQQYRFYANVFSGNEFCPKRDIQQNVFTETFALMCPKRANVFSGNEFPRIRDILQNTTWCLFLSWLKGIRCHCKINMKNKKLKAFEK